MAIRKDLLEGLTERRKTVFAAGGTDKIQARHEKGLLSARERLETMFQPDTFQEFGTHIRHTATHFGMAGKDIEKIVTSSEKISRRGAKIEALELAEPGDADSKQPAAAPRLVAGQ